MPSASANAPSTIDADPIPDAERRAITARIAFISERDGNPEIYVIHPSGEERRLTSTPAGEYLASASPDGTALLVVAAEEHPETKAHFEQILLLPLDGTPATPLGPRGSRIRNPHWSPDGQWLVFESDANNFSDIYRVNRDGKGLRPLTKNDEGNFDPALSADGKNIAFVSSRDGDPEIYRMRADGTAQTRLTAFHREDRTPRWSPDGTQIAFVSDREGRDRIFVMSATGTQLRPLTAACATSTSKPTTPGGAPQPPAEAAPSTTSAPSGEAAPPAPSAAPAASPPASSASSVSSAAPAGDAAAPQLAGEIEPLWSPDGKRIAYLTQIPGVKPRIWLADLATGACTPLTSSTHGAETPAWSPDGRYLAFASTRTGDPELYLMRADGTGQTRLTRAKGPDWLPRWVPAARPAPR
ncbi:PD40 domain-containing protein [Chondromyces apiculatus]|uniref:TolB protein n=1 Tax=Chondromyces apiculatus DSM 436 TaxID=1192034 RepID=A0A017T4M2_9BACT|nr:PD40 domain-containing protein [Chondromyces apiculatus]EYF04208.1 tolB protein precursor [Chondromyces apiculatus DSM 436]